MFFKISLVVAVAFCVQANVAFAQQPQGFAPQGAQSWDPYSWAKPYYAAATNAWMDYVQKAQQSPQQIYPQYDKAGAGNMMATGMKYAQQAQKIAEEAMKMATQEAMKYAMMG